MMNDNNTLKQHKVRAIKNGTVIDHLPENSIFKVLKLLKLEDSCTPIIFGMNLDSKRMGKKSIIKMVDVYCQEEELAYLALVAPAARVSIIKDFVVAEKREIEPPTLVEGFVKCVNPMCITNHETITTRFTTQNEFGELLLKCRYCEKITSQEQIQITK